MVNVVAPTYRYIKYTKYTVSLQKTLEKEMETPLRRSARLMAKENGDDDHAKVSISTPSLQSKRKVKTVESTVKKTPRQKSRISNEENHSTNDSVGIMSDNHHVTPVKSTISSSLSDTNHTADSQLLEALQDLLSTTVSGDSNSKSPTKPAMDNIGLIEPISILPQYLYVAPCLCSIGDVPVWQAQLAGINNGYRRCDNFYDALMSLFYWHNESMNMWIHYVGTAFLAWRAHHYSHLIWEQSTSSSNPSMEKIFLITCILMGQVFPILFSALCHHFYCVSKDWHKLFWYLDFTGILSGITWGALSFLYLAFYSNTTLMSTFMTIVISGHLYALYHCWTRFSKRADIEPLHPRDRMPEFSFVLSTFSALCYSSTVIPTLYFHGKDYFNHADLFEVASKSCMYPAGMALGILVFAQGHIPERFTGVLGLPDHFFDYFGHSHQLWHVVSFTLLYLWIEIIYKHYHARMDITDM